MTWWLRAPLLVLAAPLVVAAAAFILLLWLLGSVVEILVSALEGRKPDFRGLWNIPIDRVKP